MFTPTQIGITFLSFSVAVFLAVWWYLRDKNVANKESNVESFPVLMSLFFWSAFLALILKMILDLGVHYVPQMMQRESIFVITLALEEFIKAAALIIGLHIAGKKFNEVSDGVVYGVFAALGFIFFENIFYLLGLSPNIYDFTIMFLGRNIFSFAAHLSIVIFGVFYANACMHSERLEKDLMEIDRVHHLVAPYRVDMMFKSLWHKYSMFTIVWLIFSPFFLIYQMFIDHHRIKITMSEMLLGGFIFSVYVHVGYDYLLGFNISWLNTLSLSAIGILMVLLFHFFPKLDAR